MYNQSADKTLVLENELQTVKMLHKISSLFLDHRTSLEEVFRNVSTIISDFYSDRYSFYLSLTNFNVALCNYTFEFGQKDSHIIVSKAFSHNEKKYGEIIFSTANSTETNIVEEIDKEVFTTIITQILQYFDVVVSNIFNKIAALSVINSREAVFITDTTPKIIYANQTLFDKTGYSQEEIIGQNPSILASGHSNPDHYKDMWNTINSGFTWEGHFINKTSKGTIFEDDVTISPIKKESSEEVVGFLSIHKDVTERVKVKRMLAEVNEKRENLENVISNSPSIIFMMEVPNINDLTSSSVVYLSDNVKSYFGYTPEEFYRGEQTFEKVIYDDDRQTIFGTIIQNVADPSVSSYTQRYRLQKKSGDIVWVETHTNIKKNLLTGSTFLQGFIIDISEKLVIEERLNQSQKMESIGQLAAGIAHEINTPLQFVLDNNNFVNNSITDLVEIIEQDNDEKREEVKEKIGYDFIIEELPLAAEQSVNGIERISKIIQAMKRFSHPGVDGKVLADLNESIESTIVISENSWKYNSEVSFVKNRNGANINCYVDELNQVFLNLIVNAVHSIEEKFGEGVKKGKIEIFTEYTDDHLKVEFKDNGNGMTDSVKKRIFDPFFTTKEIGKGTGQGLALTYDIVYNKHKGFIDVDSTVGVGTTFKIFIPREKK